VKFCFVIALLCDDGCRDRETSTPVGNSPLETGVARELTARLGMPVTAHCVVLAGVASCRALAGGVALPIVVENHQGAWDWRVDAHVVATAPIAARIADELTDLGTAQTVDCGSAVALGDRVTCRLSGGGVAFASIARDGTVTFELAIDPAAAAARSESGSDLTARSRALEHSGGERDEDDEVTAPLDGGK
jgi:hypothetical protein